MNLSVVLSNYNRAATLRLVLESYLRQSHAPYEIVIADDGSSDESEEVATKFSKRAPFSIAFLSQERHGHQRAKALNNAIRFATGDWVLFSDSDSLAFPTLCQCHLQYAHPDRLLCGGYFRLNRKQSEKLDSRSIGTQGPESLMSLAKRLEVYRRAFKARQQIVRSVPRRPHNMGLNFSVSKQALLRVNGYDEYFRGWGSADGELRERLRRIGVHPYSLYAKAIVAHIWHPRDPSKIRTSVKRNRSYAHRDDIPLCPKRGLQQ